MTSKMARSHKQTKVKMTCWNEKQNKSIKDEDDLELQSVKDEPEVRFSLNPTLASRFIQNLKRPTTSIIRRAFNRNRISSEMLQVYKVRHNAIGL